MAKRFRLQIECDNAAFDDDAQIEIARILREVADRVVAGACDLPQHRNLHDANGNPVGTFVLREEEGL